MEILSALKKKLLKRTLLRPIIRLSKTTFMDGTKRQLVLHKGAEKYVFRYEKGSEDKLLDALIEQAKDKRTSFDWFDAAVVSFRLTQSLIGQADEILRQNANIKVRSS
jgi:hypothetical protein